MKLHELNQVTIILSYHISRSEVITKKNCAIFHNSLWEHSTCHITSHINAANPMYLILIKDRFNSVTDNASKMKIKVSLIQWLSRWVINQFAFLRHPQAANFATLGVTGLIAEAAWPVDEFSSKENEFYFWFLPDMLSHRWTRSGTRAMPLPDAQPDDTGETIDKER